MTYRVADGHDVALVSLSDVDPQPRSTGIQTTRRTFAADGTVQDDGKYIILEFTALASASEYQSVLSEFGIQTATSNDVTVYIRDETFAWARYNGTAIRPQPGQDVKWKDYFPRDVAILIRDLEASS
jgi:hypothetical protein